MSMKKWLFLCFLIMDFISSSIITRISVFFLSFFIFHLYLYSYLSPYKVRNHVFLFTVERFCAVVEVSSQEYIKLFNHKAP